MSTTITGLPNATTPLSGTERVPMDQAGATKDATTQDIANLAPGTDLSYNAGTRQLISSTGVDTTLPLAGADAGLLSAADKAKVDSITVDRATLTVVTVRNDSGVSIPKGTAVYVTGSSGTTVTVALADASTEATAANTLGVAFEAIANNSSGLIVTEGELAGLNTAALTEGGLLWLSETTGGLTTTRPTQPAHGVVMGWCVKQGSGSGIIYVRVDNGQELEELHDVLITSPSTGQVLRRASDGLWRNHTLTAGDVGAATTAQGAKADTAVQPGSLATVATSGAYADLSGRPTLGTAAALSVGTSAGNVVQLDGSGRLPAVDGSQLTGLASAPVQSVAGRTGVVVLSVTDVANAVSTNDSRLSDAREWSAVTVSQADAEAGTATDRRAWTVQRVWQAIVAWWTASSTAAGRALVTAADAAAQRTALGLGTAATTAASAYATAAQGALAATAAQQGTITSSGLTMATARILARSTAGTGAVEEHTLPTGFDLSSGALRAPAEIGLACSDETTALTTGASKLTFRMPYAMTLTAVRLSVTTAPTGSALIVDVNEAGVSVFSTNPRIDAGSTTSVGSGTPAVISDVSLADNALITIDIDQIGATVAGAGLKVWLIGRRA